MSLTESDWAYWLKLKSWNAEEATFILMGILPSDGSSKLYQSLRKNPEQYYNDIYKAVVREFSAEKVPSKDCLKWAIDFGITLTKKLQEEINKIDNTLLSKPKESQQGKASIEKRNILLSLALYLINEENKYFTGKALLRKPNGKISIENLTDAIEKNKNLINKAGSPKFNYTHETISRNLSEAINLKIRD